ncbi:MAG: exo-alpha-sialidase [Planctomycetota bacterium]|nr:exo-alpha-sialidase [Planctomycetota bacterium]
MRLLVGTRKGLFFLSRKASGDSWNVDNVAFLGDPVPMFLSDQRDGSVYAALNLGHFGVKMHRSTDAGKSWEPCAAPIYPAANGAGDPTAPPLPDAPPVKGASLEYVWALETADPKTAGTLWCGTVPGGLFYSSDFGKSWELNTSLWENPKRKEWFGGGMGQPGVHSVCVHPENSSHLTLGVSCGGVWITKDAGSSWDCQADGMFAAYMPPDRAADPNIQDPHRVAQSPADPNVLWAQHHNGIFKTDDGCKSWYEIKSAGPSTFGFAAVAHPADAKTAWFVPAKKDECRVPVDGKVVVTRTRDGGKSFQTLSRGLPQENAYHIVFRHGMDVAPDGETLAFGSTTGGLWTTDNAGDAWQQVSSDLPPIYCVRFEP